MASVNYSSQRAQYEAALQNRNVRAMLDAIAKAEGTFGRGDNGYNINVGGRTFNNNYARHPEIMVQLTPRLRSNAAGRYQFLSTTWNPLARQLGLNDFSPRNQDIGAVGLIAQAGALNDVMRGDVPTAARKLHGVWASLPGSQYGQPTLSLARFTNGFREALAAIGRGFHTVVNAIGNAFSPAPPPRPSEAIPQQQTTMFRMHSVDGSPDAPPPQPSSYAPPYASTPVPPFGGIRPEFRQAAPTPSWVNTPAPAAAVQSNVIMGDSIGASMKWAYPDTKNVAVGGVSIAAAAAQFRKVQQGSVADVVLGSNNGTYSDTENRRQVQQFLNAADQRGVRINNWVLPGNHQGHARNDAGLARAADVIRQAVHDYNQSHPDRAPIRAVTTRDRGIQKDADGLHLTPAGTKQIRTLIASAQPPAPAPTPAPASGRPWRMQDPNHPRSTA